MAKIRLSPLAVADLQEIKTYITDELCNPDAANHTVSNIIKDYSRLADMPQLGPSLSSILPIETEYHFLVIGKYMVFYQADDAYVSIYRILYGVRDYMKTLFIDHLAEEGKTDETLQ